MYCYNNPSAVSSTAVIVYYRYLQRGRLIRYLSRILRQGDAMLAPPLARLYLNRRMLTVRPKSKFLDGYWSSTHLNDRFFRG